MNLSCNRIKRVGAGLLLAALTFSGSAGIASAQQWQGGPPPPRHEMYVHRDGHAWENGHWRRAGNRWVWVNGHEVFVGHGRWIAGHWAHGPQGRFWVEGHRA